MWTGKSNDKLILNRSDQKGQILIEALLLMIVSLGLLVATLNYFKETKTLNKVTNTIWSGVGQMTEFGNWPTAAPPVHPNSTLRTRIVDPTQ